MQIPGVCKAFVNGEWIPFIPMHVRRGDYVDGPYDDTRILYAAGWAFRPGHHSATYLGPAHTRYGSGDHGELPSEQPTDGSEAWWKPEPWGLEVRDP